MTQIIIDDPDLYTVKEVDGSGRIYLGTDWAGKEVKIAIEEVQGDESGNPMRVTADD